MNKEILKNVCVFSAFESEREVEKPLNPDKGGDSSGMNRSAFNRSLQKAFIECLLRPATKDSH